MNLSLTSSSVSFGIVISLHRLDDFDDLRDVGQSALQCFGDLDENGGGDVLVPSELGNGSSADASFLLEIALQSAFVDELLSQ